MSRRLLPSSLALGLLLTASCNSSRLADSTACQPGDTTCDETLVTPKPKPKPPGPGMKLRIGPKAPVGFDTKQDGSYGVQTDKDGNVILDPSGKIATTTPVIWVANSSEGTVSKIDTRKMIEVARYYTYPGGGADPSRTTVGLQGDVVVANRASSGGAKASAVRIAGDRSSCIDRNGNGVIDTSENTVAGQAATPIPWATDKPNDPADECILWMTPLTPNSYPRAAGYNAGFAEGDTYIYIGLYSTKQVVRLDQKTGRILKTINVSPAMPYGLVIDKNADVWVRGAEGSLARIQVSKADAVEIFSGSLAPPCPYGIAADARGYIYTAGSTCVSRLDPVARTWEKLDLRSYGSILYSRPRARQQEPAVGRRHQRRHVPRRRLRSEDGLQGQDRQPVVEQRRCRDRLRQPPVDHQPDQQHGVQSGPHRLLHPVNSRRHRPVHLQRHDRLSAPQCRSPNRSLALHGPGLRRQQPHQVDQPRLAGDGRQRHRGRHQAALWLHQRGSRRSQVDPSRQGSL
jgi:DNA-binding beta-propeller fold protein YncE